MYRFKQYGITFFLLIFIHSCLAQTKEVSDSLSQFNKRIGTAKLSNDTKTILQTYSTNIFTSKSWTSNEDFQQIAQFTREGIDFAKSVNEYDYVVIGYTHLAVIFRLRNEAENATSNALLATGNAEKIKSDSLKAIAYIELGDCYQLKSEPVKACINFNKAFDLALKDVNYTLESNISLRLANLYYMQGDTIEAIKQINKSITVNRKSQSGEGLIKDYTQLGRITDKVSYIDTVFALADSLGLKDKIYRARRTLLDIYGFVEKNPEKALNYLNSQKDIKDNLMKNGMEYYYWYIGQIYISCNLADSGLHYLKMASPKLVILKPSLRKIFYKHMAGCYNLKNEPGHAIYFYEKMLEDSRKDDDRSYISLASDSLSKLYYQTGDYKKAIKYMFLAKEMMNSLAISARGKDLVLLEMARVTKKHHEEIRQGKERLQKEHNLQYMAIIIFICIVFLILTIFGMFPISKLAIRMSGFIAFICLFEFIILLIEHSVIHPLTHGDPLKTWLLKIILIVILVRSQGFLEHRFIHLLQSQKLHKTRRQLLALKLWKKKKLVQKNESED